MYKTRMFITECNGIITSRQETTLAKSDLFGTPYYTHNQIDIPHESKIMTGDKVEFYDQNWKRKSDVELIDEGKIPMPQGYIREGSNLRQMTRDERIISGLDEPSPGTKIIDGKIKPMTEIELINAGLVELQPGQKIVGDEIVSMSLQEKLTAKQISKEEYDQQIAAENEAELQNRLAALQTPEAFAMAEVDEVYAVERKAKLIALLTVKQQKGYPLVVDWSRC